MRTTRTLTRGRALAAAVSLVALTATACGSDPKTVVPGTYVSGGTTTLKLDSAFAASLVSLKLTPTASGGATLDLSAGTLTVPVSGGRLRIYKKGDVTPTVQGAIDHNNATVTLKSGSTTVDLKNLVVDPGTKPRVFGEIDVDGKSKKTNYALFDLDATSTQAPSVSGSSVTITSSTVKLDGGAAGVLNDAFGIKTLKGGTLVGQLTTKVDTTSTEPASSAPSSGGSSSGSAAPSSSPASSTSS